MEVDNYETRMKMSKMHSYFQKDYLESIRNGDYSKAIMIAYNICENRTFRILVKVPELSKLDFARGACEVKLENKLQCSTQLIEMEHPYFADFSPNLVQEIRKWRTRRNKMSHELIKLDTYGNSAEDIKNLALDSKIIVSELYAAAKKVRGLSRTTDFSTLPKVGVCISKKCFNKTERQKLSFELK